MWSLFAWLLVVCDGDYYSFDGTGNNLDHPLYGTKERPFLRYEGEIDYLSYSDHEGELDTSKPNARKISNILGQLPQSQSKYTDYAPLSGIAWSWATILALDICNQRMDISDDSYAPIDVPACDWYLDPDCSNNIEMPFYRAQYVNVTIDNRTKLCFLCLCEDIYTSVFNVYISQSYKLWKFIH